GPVLCYGIAGGSGLMLAAQDNEVEVTTIEGLAGVDGLHPLQQAFRETLAFQCGYCTPGFVMTAVELLRENPSPSEREIREAISGNLCRCTGYESIVRALALAAELAQPASPAE